MIANSYNKRLETNGNDSVMFLYLQEESTTFVGGGLRTCPDTEGTHLLYSGVAAGSYYSHKGGEFLGITAGTQDIHDRVYGAEYEACIWQS